MDIEGRPQHATERPLRAQVARVIGALVFVVLGLLGVSLVVHHAREARGNAARRLEVAARNRAAAVDEYLDDHLRAVSIFAATMPLEEGAVPPAVAGERLASIRELFPSFLTMIVADRDGAVIAADPATSASGESILALHQNVSDREYFERVVASRQPFVSSAFRGRGFGEDPIVAVSAPIISGGPVIAVAEGSLDLRAFSEFLNALSDIEGVSLLIVDEESKVVFSSGAHARPPLTRVADAPIVLVANDAAPGVAFAYEEPGAGEFLASAVRTRRGWRVFVRQPVEVIESEVVGDVIFAAIATFAATGLGLLLATWLASRVTRPLEVMVGAVNILRSGARKVDLEVSAGAPREVRELMERFSEMSADLAAADHELRQLLDKEAALRGELEAEREDLRVEVGRRIAAQKKLEVLNRELEIARDQALDGSRAKSAFLARMSHELKTPLNAILGFSGILEGELGRQKNPRLVEQAHLIQAAGRSLLRLVDDLLEVARLETGDVELRAAECDLGDLLRQAAERASRDAGPDHVPIEVDVAQLGVARLDGEKLLHALTTLVGNALKFTKEGSVSLRGWYEILGGRDTLVVTVSDTGVGIPQEAVSKVFDLFAQGDDSLSRRLGGAGVGLAIARRLCELMGGRIDVASVERAGSIFTLRVPVERG